MSSRSLSALGVEWWQWGAGAGLASTGRHLHVKRSAPLMVLKLPGAARSGFRGAGGSLVAYWLCSSARYRQLLATSAASWC